MRYLLIIGLSLSLMIRPEPARAEFTSLVLGMAIGIVVAEVFHYNDFSEEGEKDR